MACSPGPPRARYGRFCMVTMGPAKVLHGRRSEREALGGLLEAVRGGQSRVSVLYGEGGLARRRWWSPRSAPRRGSG